MESEPAYEALLQPQWSLATVVLCHSNVGQQTFSKPFYTIVLFCGLSTVVCGLYLKLFQNPFTFVLMQQYFNPKLYEALKEVFDNQALCNLTYYEGGNKKTLISIRIAEMGAGYLVTERGEQIAVSDIIALNGKPAQFFV